MGEMRIYELKCLFTVNAVSNDQYSMVQVLWVAEELKWMTNTAHVELHSISVDTDGNRSVLYQPFSHIRLVTANVHCSRDLYFS